MTAPKTPKAAPAPTSPEDVLKAAIDTFVAAAVAYAAQDQATTTHSVTSGDYRVRYQGDELLSLSRI